MATVSFLSVQWLKFYFKSNEECIGGIHGSYFCSLVLKHMMVWSQVFLCVVILQKHNGFITKSSFHHSPDKSSWCILLECLISKITDGVVDLSFLKSYWIKFGLQLGEISNSFWNSSQHSSTIGHYTLMWGSQHDKYIRQTSINSEQPLPPSSNTHTRFNYSCENKPECPSP